MSPARATFESVYFLFTASSASVGTLGSLPFLKRICPVAVSPPPAKKLVST